MGYAAGKEAAAIGVNWMFNPVADVYKNWRNTIVNTRSFGSDPDRVIACDHVFHIQRKFDLIEGVILRIIDL